MQKAPLQNSQRRRADYTGSQKLVVWERAIIANAGRGYKTFRAPTWYEWPISQTARRADSRRVTRLRTLRAGHRPLGHIACQPGVFAVAEESQPTTGVVLLDMSGKVLACSEEAARMLGFDSASGVVGQERLFDPAQMAAGEVTVAGVRVQTEPLLKVDGSPYAILTRLQPLQ